VADVIELGDNRYGKQAIRLVKVVRDPGGHRVRDLTVGVALEGDFAAVHTDGDNTLVVATDTMKNTVYALAADHLTGPVEAFGTLLATHFLAFPQVHRATVTIREQDWAPIFGADGPALDALQRTGGAIRTATLVAVEEGTIVESGLDDLVVMKTTRSAFSGFDRDRFTTLAETRDRIMATRVTATWRHSRPPADWDESHAAISGTLLEVFAGHFSESVQQSIWLMATAMLERHPGIDEVRMALPNLHHWAVDLTPFGGTNRGDIFVATTEPHGLIEATVRRPAS
jgi:urate oxidase